MLLGDGRKLSAEVFMSYIYLFIYLLSIPVLTCFSEANHTGKSGNTQHCCAAICEGLISSVQLKNNILLGIVGSLGCRFKSSPVHHTPVKHCVTSSDGTLHGVLSIKHVNGCSGMGLI